MSRRALQVGILLLLTLGFASHAFAVSTGAVTITGQPNPVNGIPDLGWLRVTVNGYPETVPYGEYSTRDSIASAIAAKFSSDCNGPANARSRGNTISFRMKGSAVMADLTVTASGVSFAGVTNLGTSMIPTTTLATMTSTVIHPGQAATQVTGQVSCGSQCGNQLFDFAIDGGTPQTGYLDGNGHFSASVGAGSAVGLHNVVVNYRGSDTYLPSISNPVSFSIVSESAGRPPLYYYNISSYDGTGNVKSYTDSVNGSWTDISYDGVNRLTSATQLLQGGSTQYLCWGYDSFGNRLAQNISNQTFYTGTPSCQAQSNASAALVAATYNAKNQIDGLSYDAVGNMISDGSHNYLYDAENRVCAVSWSPITGITVMTQYIYDAEGRRVAKGNIATWTCDPTSPGYSFTETADYVLGPNGEQVTELDGNGTWVHTNVYAAGSLIATYENDQHIHFHLNDWLGTRRVQTDYAGTPEASYQTLPFGEMVPDNYHANLGATEQHFTGKERDAESGLDYFGARYYSSNMGRWMSPDWADRPEAVPYSHLDNPQSLNLYGYVGNNPLSKPDLDGHGCPPDCAGHTGVFGLAQDWLDVVEVKGSLGIGVGASGQAGVAEYKYEATLVGVEAGGGLGGGNWDAKAVSEVRASGKVGPGSAEVKAGGEISVVNGASASAGAKVSAGSMKASASAGTDGAHASATANAKQSSDVKLGGSLKAGVGMGASVNVSQAGRAYDNTAAAFKAVGQYVNNLLRGNR